MLAPAESVILIQPLWDPSGLSTTSLGANVVEMKRSPGLSWPWPSRTSWSTLPIRTNQEQHRASTCMTLLQPRRASMVTDAFGSRPVHTPRSKAQPTIELLPASLPHLPASGSTIDDKNGKSQVRYHHGLHTASSHASRGWLPWSGSVASKYLVNSHEWRVGSNTSVDAGEGASSSAHPQSTKIDARPSRS